MPVGGSRRTRPRGVRCKNPAWIRIGLVQILECSAIFTERGCERPDSHGAARELLDDRVQDAAVELVEAVFVDLEAGQGRPGRREDRYRAAGDLGEIAQPPKQAVGDTRGPAAAARDLAAPASAVTRRPESARSAGRSRQRRRIVEVQARRRCRSGRAAGWREVRAASSRRSA